MRETGQMRAFLRGERKISHDNRFAIFGFSIAWAAIVIATASLIDSAMDLLFWWLSGFSADDMDALIMLLPMRYHIGALFAIPLAGSAVLAVSGRARRWRLLFCVGIVVAMLALIALVEVRLDVIQVKNLIFFTAGACILKVAGWVFIVWALAAGGTAWVTDRFLE